MSEYYLRQNSSRFFEILWHIQTVIRPKFLIYNISKLCSHRFNLHTNNKYNTSIKDQIFVDQISVRLMEFLDNYQTGLVVLSTKNKYIFTQCVCMINEANQWLFFGLFLEYRRHPPLKNTIPTLLIVICMYRTSKKISKVILLCIIFHMLITYNSSINK